MFRKVKTSPVTLKYMPAPKYQQVVNFATLTGGMNLYELDYRLPSNESPEIENLMWREGALNSRDGQAWLFSNSGYNGHTMYERLWHGKIISHRGGRLCWTDVEAGGANLICTGVPEKRGTFFEYDDHLYYKNPGGYFCLSYNEETGAISGARVTGYVPTILINTDPVTAAGTLYQPENRLSSYKKVQYTVTTATSDFQLPVKANSVTKVTIDNAEVSFTYDSSTGKVHTSFVAPVAVNGNSVEITYLLANDAAMQSVMDCPYAAVYGGASGSLCIVLGGCPAQPNAYFWNGHNVAMDPSYFPMDQYQLAGDASEAITGFGKQQSYLVIFKEHSIGRTSFSTVDVDGRTTEDFAYSPINSRIGCDLPWSIQLIENYLVWCNTEQGVFLLNNLSAAFENNVTGLSKKINGEGLRGLLHDLRSGHLVCSLDDDTRYWLCVNGHVWVWDYELSTFKNPSWFYWSNISPVALCHHHDQTWHLNERGRITVMTRSFKDYGKGIKKRYRFATQYFGTYDNLKNINSVIFVMRSDTPATVEMTYTSDYETRKDLTDLVSNVKWTISRRNLTYRTLEGTGFGTVLRRKPMCRRVKHFTMTVDNSNPGEDLSIVSAQIFYYLEGKYR